MRKRTSRIFPDGKTECYEVYAPFNGGWQYCDAIYKCDENGVMNCLWKKLDEEPKTLVDVHFETVSNIYDNYYAILNYRSYTDGKYHNGVAYITNGKWVLLKELGIMNITKYVLHATTRGFVLGYYSTPNGSEVVASGLFRGWFYGLKKEIEDNNFELHELELLDDGDVLFDEHTESIKLIPKLNTYKQHTSPFNKWDSMTSSYITKKYKYEYEKVVWEETTEDGITVRKEGYKWRLYDWKGNAVTKPEDVSEFTPDEKTETVRAVSTGKYPSVGIQSTAITYLLSKRETSVVEGNYLAMMVGSPKFNVGEDCSQITVQAVSGIYGARDWKNNGKTFQETQETCLSIAHERLMVMSAGFGTKYDEYSYVEESNIGVYAVHSGGSIGYIYENEVTKQGEFNPYFHKGACPNFSVYGLYYTDKGSVYALIERSGITKLYLGRYDDKTHKFSFIDWDEDFQYPYSFGGIIPGEDEDYIVISKSTDNYHAKKNVYNSQGDIVDIPVYV